MIAIAREKATRAEIPNLDFAQCGAVEALAPLQTRDLVVAHSLLHLVDDWRGLITAAHRVLVPGGALVMTTMCLQDGYSFIRPVAPLGRRQLCSCFF